MWENSSKLSPDWKLTLLYGHFQVYPRQMKLCIWIQGIKIYVICGLVCKIPVAKFMHLRMHKQITGFSYNVVKHSNKILSFQWNGWNHLDIPLRYEVLYREADCMLHLFWGAYTKVSIYFFLCEKGKDSQIQDLISKGVCRSFGEEETVFLNS